MRGAAQIGNALDLHPARPRAADARPHRRQQRGEIDDFGLARRVLDHRRSLGQGGGHHEVLGARHGDQIGRDPRSLQTARARHDIPVLDGDLGAEAGDPRRQLAALAPNRGAERFEEPSHRAHVDEARSVREAHRLLGQD